MDAIRITAAATGIQHINSQKSIVTEDELRPLVTEFVSKLELHGEFNTDILEQIQLLEINHEIFNQMLNELDSFLEFDDVDDDEVNFPYENWISRMLLINSNYKA